jgi:hypothetical protein
MTLIDLRRMNIAWSEDDFLDVYSVADFLSDGECEPQHLRLRFAMSLYGSRLVKRFNACTVWVE